MNSLLQILYVDASFEFSIFMKEILESEIPCEVHCVHTVAKSKYSISGGKYDIVICGLRFSDGSGLDVYLNQPNDGSAEK